VSSKLSVRDLNVEGRRVFCRVDFNVPLEEDRITDDVRITASLPTIRLLLERGARVVLCSHLGRPKGKPNPAMSLRPAARRLSELLAQDVALAPDCVGPAVEAAVKGLAPGRAILLENLRFHAEEEKNDSGFSAQLAALGDVYVNDAFGTAHRAHASTVGVPKILTNAAAGLLMDAELQNLSVLLHDPARPYAAVLGGAKISDKLDLIRNLFSRVDRILVGGAMAYTFLKARGVEVGDSRVEADLVDTARALGGEARERGVALLLPVDHSIRIGADDSGEIATTPGEAIPPGGRGLDIGPATIKAFCAALADARTVLWNGPVGLFEQPPFDRGSRAVAEAIVASGAHSVVGGGDSASAVKRFGLETRFTHVSTGGGATLEYLSGLALPGVEALQDAEGRRSS
jgi:phosphoglycerate kinase